MLIQADLDALWDFADAAGSEARLRAAAAAESGTVRAELETQVARAMGLQERYAEADMILEAIGDQAPVVRVRVALERGRVRNASGDPAGATPLLREAASLAGSAGLTFLRVDALHMLAIADADHAEAWTREALAVLGGVDDPRTQRWAVALHNNAGRSHFDGRRFVEALSEFLQAKDAAVRWGTPQQVRFADEALEECRAAIASPGR
jgi:hypothetical protein